MPFACMRARLIMFNQIRKSQVIQQKTKWKVKEKWRATLAIVFGISKKTSLLFATVGEKHIWRRHWSKSLGFGWNDLLYVYGQYKLEELALAWRRREGGIEEGESLIVILNELSKKSTETESMFLLACSTKMYECRPGESLIISCTVCCWSGHLLISITCLKCSARVNEYTQRKLASMNWELQIQRERVMRGRERERSCNVSSYNETWHIVAIWFTQGTTTFKGLEYVFQFGQM